MPTPKTIEVPTLEYLKLKGPWRGDKFTKVDNEGVHLSIEKDCGCDITPRSMGGVDTKEVYYDHIKRTVELVRDLLGEDVPVIIHLNLRKAEGPLYPIVAPIDAEYDEETDRFIEEYPEGFRSQFEEERDIKLREAKRSCNRVPKIEGVIWRLSDQ